MLNIRHKSLLFLSALVIAAQLTTLYYFRDSVIDWVSHNLWVVAVPFLQTVFKKTVAIKLISLFKYSLSLLLHLSKLLLLKLLKTIGVRYGVFFSLYRWYHIRRRKVLFVRRSKQWFRRLRRFWNQYKPAQRWLIWIAFFPVVLVLFIVGLSFNVTRRTLVQKTQETAIFKAAANASAASRGIRAGMARLDQITLQRIQKMTMRNPEVNSPKETTETDNKSPSEPSR